MNVKRKTPVIVKIIAVLLLAASLVMLFLPWLKILVEIPMLGRRMNLEEMLQLSGQSSDSMLEEVRSGIQDAIQDVYDSTGVTVDGESVLKLVRSVMHGSFSPLNLATTLSTAKQVLGQFTKALEIQSQNSSGITAAQISAYLPMVRQANSSIGTWSIVLWALLALLAILGIVALACAISDHKLGILPYLLLSAGTLAGTLLLRSSLNNSMTNGMQLASMGGADLSALNMLGINMNEIFRMGIAAYLCVALALLAFLLMFIKEKKSAPAPMTGGYTPSPYPARQTAPQAGQTAAPARPAASPWTCPNCGSVRGGTERFCGTCGGKRPEAPTPRRCSRCGVELPSTALFCTNCGLPQSQPAAPAPQNVRLPGDGEL